MGGRGCGDAGGMWVCSVTDRIQVVLVREPVSPILVFGDGLSARSVLEIRTLCTALRCTVLHCTICILYIVRRG